MWNDKWEELFFVASMVVVTAISRSSAEFISVLNK